MPLLDSLSKRILSAGASNPISAARRFGQTGDVKSLYPILEAALSFGTTHGAGKAPKTTLQDLVEQKAFLEDLVTRSHGAPRYVQELKAVNAQLRSVKEVGELY